MGDSLISSVVVLMLVLLVVVVVVRGKKRRDCTVGKECVVMLESACVREAGYLHSSIDYG